jgi:membrane protein YdbS with pleckstrin-like domain
MVTPLEPGQLWLMRIHAFLAALFLLLAAAAAEYALPQELGLPRGIVVLPLLLPLLYLVFISPGRRYRAWGYAMEAEELGIAHGVWTRVETTVPLGRVQHIDVSQGPLERSLGVCRLVLHTAGTMSSRVVLPGLSRATAERIRDEVRARIREDAL